ncbi:MAG: hypothetical protein IKU35_06355 [Bacteroidaceae bacterium]|nr:hypothetical protein [Bacteroidaceae bacterium]
MEQKAILEIDLPNSCSECPLCDIIHGTGCSYWADELDTPTDKRHNLCPLKPKRTRPVETEEEKQTKLCRARRVLSQYNRATLNRILTANGDCEYDKELYQAIEDVLGELRFRSDSHCALFVIDVGSKKRRIHRIGTDIHDALSVYDWDGKREIHYSNMQNGDGGTAEEQNGHGYVILQSEDGYLTNEYDKIIDRRFVEEIKQFLKEEYGQEVDDG